MQVRIKATKKMVGRGYDVQVEFQTKADRLRYFRLMRKAEQVGAWGLDGELFLGNQVDAVRHAERKGWLGRP